MVAVDILIPVLARPERVRPLVESIAASSRFTPLLPIFLCSPGDTDEIAEAEAAVEEYPLGAGQVLVVDWEPDAGDYAKKINYGFRVRAFRGFPFAFLASDDLVFHPGWIERALATYLETNACVIGTNDAGNRATENGSHSTHTLVHRDYGDCGTFDEPDSGKLLYEGYDHNFVDTEFVATAIRRETWAHATDSIVEHLHPFWHKAEEDATYRKGQRAYSADRQIFNSRLREIEAS